MAAMTHRPSRYFEFAAMHDPPVVWPYFFLAHQRLAQNRFADCFELCGRALRLPVLDPIRANLLEWVAICQWHLRFPRQVVQASFDAAMELAPDNERIAANFRLFRAVTERQGNGDPAWERQASSTVRALGEAEPDSLLTTVN